MAGDHTAGVSPALRIVARLQQGGGRGTPTTSVPTDVDFTLGSVAEALLLACLAAVPLGVSIWALLDAARRPRWAWALSGRRQVVWMALILFGVFSVIGGLLISGYYLARVRPRIAGVEGGEL